jgi:hypothetical protein
MAANEALRLVRWLPKLAEPTAEEVVRYGPNAARIKTLMQFLPTVSDEAAIVAYDAGRSPRSVRNPDTSWLASKEAVKRSGREANDELVFQELEDMDLYNIDSPAVHALRAELVSDYLNPRDYRVLTNDLETGRAFDVLSSRPRLQNSSFGDLVGTIGERGLLDGPRDIVAMSRLSRKPEDVREIAMTLIADGMAPEDAVRAAGML